MYVANLYAARLVLVSGNRAVQEILLPPLATATGHRNCLDKSQKSAKPWLTFWAEKRVQCTQDKTTFTHKESTSTSPAACLRYISAHSNWTELFCDSSLLLPLPAMESIQLDGVDGYNFFFSPCSGSTWWMPRLILRFTLDFLQAEFNAKKASRNGKKATAQSSSISILSVLVDADLSSSASTEWDRSERFRWKTTKNERFILDKGLPLIAGRLPKSLPCLMMFAACCEAGVAPIYSSSYLEGISMHRILV